MTMLVSYLGNARSRFDREYYVTHHLPLVTRSWQRYGLQEVEAYFGCDVGDGGRAVAICLCHFDDHDAIERALSAPESEAVMHDVAAFTDIEPSRTVMIRTRPDGSESVTGGICCDRQQDTS